MEENNFNNEAPVENVAPEISVEAPMVEESVVEAPMPETKVEEVAAENNIEASVSEATESTDAITTSDFSRSSSDTVQAVGSIANGVIGVAEAPRPVRSEPKPSTSKPKQETVALYSTKNVVWNKVGKIKKGVNIVPKDKADQWLTRDHVRLMDPSEVAKEFGR